MLTVLPLKRKVLDKKLRPSILLALVPVFVSYLSFTDLSSPVRAADKSSAADFYDLTLEELMRENVGKTTQKKDRRKV